MNLKLCEKRFLVINSPFFLHVPAFVLDCVHAVQGRGGGGGAAVGASESLILTWREYCEIRSEN